MVAFELRNGFGFDIELSNARPVGIVLEQDEPAVLGFFEGFVIMIPLLTILIGDVYTQEDED